MFLEKFSKKQTQAHPIQTKFDRQISFQPKVQPLTATGHYLCPWRQGGEYLCHSPAINSRPLPTIVSATSRSLCSSFSQVPLSLSMHHFSSLANPRIPCFCFHFPLFKLIFLQNLKYLTACFEAFYISLIVILRGFSASSNIFSSSPYALPFLVIDI